MTLPLGTAALVLVGTLLVTVVLGMWWRRRQGVVRTRGRAHPARRTEGATRATTEEVVVDWAAHGVALGSRRTFVQLSAELCAACRSTARVLADVAAEHDDVTHREMDVDDHLDLVRAFAVLRTPTVLVLDARGREVARASGGMTRTQALAALVAGNDDTGAVAPRARPA